MKRRTQGEWRKDFRCAAGREGQTGDVSATRSQRTLFLTGGQNTVSLAKILIYTRLPCLGALRVDTHITEREEDVLWTSPEGERLW